MGRIRPTLHSSQVRAAKLTLQQKAALAQQFGYPCVNFSLADVRSVEGGPPAVRALLTRCSVEAATVSGLVPLDVLVGDEAQFQATAEVLPASARTAAGAGGRETGIVLPGYTAQPRDELWPVVVERIRRLDSALDGTGIRLGIEFIGVKTPSPGRPHPFVQSMLEALRLLEDADARHVGLTLDSLHWYAAGDTLDTIRRTPPERLVMLHLTDAGDVPREALSSQDRLLPGEGVIPLADWLRAIAGTGFDGTIGLEVTGPRAANIDAETFARLGMEAHRRTFAAAGLPLA